VQIIGRRRLCADRPIDRRAGEAPAWLLMPDSTVAEFVKLRSDLDIRVLHGLTDQQLTATYLTRK
jgi:hypothetical protein